RHSRSPDRIRPDRTLRGARPGASAGDAGACIRGTDRDSFYGRRRTRLRLSSAERYCVIRSFIRKQLLFFGSLFITCAAFSPPMRIVSTSPSITETLFALGVGTRVVGVSTYCRYPPEVSRLPKVGSYARPDPEKIALLRPDLAIIHPGSPTLSGRLIALGI